jgi:hypothetical protein
MQVAMQDSGNYQQYIKDYAIVCCNLLCEREEMISCHSGFDKDNFISHQEIAAGHPLLNILG